MVTGSNYFTILNEQPTILRDKITIKNSGNTPELWSVLMSNTPQWQVKSEAFSQTEEETPSNVLSFANV